jgi:hypothetical protein
LGPFDSGWPAVPAYSRGNVNDRQFTGCELKVNNFFSRGGAGPAGQGIAHCEVFGAASRQARRPAMQVKLQPAQSNGTTERACYFRGDTLPAKLKRMAYTVVRLSPPAADADEEAREVAVQLLRDGVAVEQVPRVRAEEGQNGWRYVWPSRDDAECAAQQLQRRTGRRYLV